MNQLPYSFACCRVGKPDKRTTLRLDVAKTVNAATPVQVWFGVQQPF